MIVKRTTSFFGSHLLVDSDLVHSLSIVHDKSLLCDVVLLLWRLALSNVNMFLDSATLLLREIYLHIFNALSFLGSRIVFGGERLD